MKKMEADIVVIAAGLSGISATVAAAESGLKVVTFEKSTIIGGAANMGIGPLAVDSRPQHMLGVNISAEEAFMKHMHYTHWMADDARLVMEFYKKTASTIDWLEDMGVRFAYDGMKLYTPVRMKHYAEPESTVHPVIPEGGGKPGPRSAGFMCKCLGIRAKELGAEIYFETPVYKILMEDNKACGVLARNKDGEEIECRAKAVIIATGGFGDNPEMIKEELGFTWGEDIFSFRIPGNVGDGMKMAWEAGAAKMKPMMELMYQIPDNLNHFALEGAFRQPMLWVNKLGKRFMPEDCIGNTATTGNAILKQPGHTCFTIMDEATLKYYKKHGVDFPGVQGEDVFDRFDDEAEAAKESNYQAYFEADSLEELCEKTGIDLEGLKETIEEYNECCEEGYDFVFGKDRRFLRPLKKPRYYAIQSFIGAYGTLGGIKINYKTEVLTPEWKTIPGLYAVGTDACNIYGDTYPFVLIGNTMAFCINSGRMAGENAAEYIESLS